MNPSRNNPVIPVTTRNLNAERLKPQIRVLGRLIEDGRILRQNGATWDEIARALTILKADGSPDKGMAFRIVQEGYEPRRIETRTRLGLPPVCPECYQRVPRRKPAAPAWVKRGADFLAQREQEMHP